jgi:hypothetical protein
MTELSPAAQAVLDAINKELDEAPWDLSFLAGASAAAALRAAVVDLRENLYDPVEGKVPVVRVEYLHAIADELESLPE